MPQQIAPLQVLQSAFPGIQEHIARQMTKAGKVCEYPENTTLCNEGAYEDVFYIILDGEVQVTKLINASEVHLMKHLLPGDFFGEMAIIHDAPRAASICTTVPTKVLEIQKSDFNDLLDNSSIISRAMILEVSRRLRENDEMAIEDLRLKAKELANAYQQLAGLEFARREFLTTIAHELRTPLMAASGFMQIISMGKLKGETLYSALDTVSKNIEDIMTLTNDILFLQEMDLILPEFQPTSISEVVVSVVEKYQKAAENNKIGMRLAIAPGLPEIKADANSLERAISAIVDNAIKFSPNGGTVLITVGKTESKWLGISIQDQGIGIAPDVLPRIYDRFFHVDQIDEHLFRGVGLGLSIARQVIEQHGGRIEVESESGKGANFTIQLKI
jgi:signal transduction histidine kinase